MWLNRTFSLLDQTCGDRFWQCMLFGNVCCKRRQEDLEDLWLLHQIRLSNMTLITLFFSQTKKLQVKYTLKRLPDVFEIRDEKCVIMGTHFYFHEKHVESRFEVNKEVARFFSDGNTECMKDLRSVSSCVSWLWMKVGSITVQLVRLMISVFGWQDFLRDDITLVKWHHLLTLPAWFVSNITFHREIMSRNG